MTFTGNDEPAAALPGEFVRNVNTLLAKTGFQEILGLNKISDKPALETADLHTFNRQSVTVALGILVAEPHPSDHLLLGVVPVDLNPEIFNGPLFNAFCMLGAFRKVKQPAL